MDIQLLGFRAAARVPRWLWWPAAKWAAAWLGRRPPIPLRQWALNAEVVTGVTPGPDDLVAAQFSWIRNTVGSLQLGSLDRESLVSLVEADETLMDWLRELHASRGLVLALPHQGSWDLAGAYACQVGLPVTSVAERLPRDQFEYFRWVREQLGFRIHPHDAGNLVPTLCTDLRCGQVVCLIADRDFGRRGIPVKRPTPKGPRELTVPAGPHLIARQTGAALVGAATHYHGDRLRIELSEEIAGDMADSAQQLTNFFATQVRAHVHDWHLMQRFFPGIVA